MRVIAVDWSGDLKNAKKKIWMAEVMDGELQRPQNGRSPSQVAEYLSGAARDESVLVGFDFAFSFPEWFVAREGCNSVFELWCLVQRQGEDWLAQCEPPFWGRPGKSQPPLSEGEPYFRQTEKDVPFGAKSVFQIGGAGAVGTGSVRGMPLLRRLHEEAGFRVWPFEDAGQRLIIEIYPRVLTGPVDKSDERERRNYIERDSRVRPEHVDFLASGEDVFDAAISALVMQDHVEELTGLRALDRPYSLEGAIWFPTTTA